LLPASAVGFPLGLRSLGVGHRDVDDIPQECGTFEGGGERKHGEVGPLKDARLHQNLNRCEQKLSPRLRDKG
jgi:hypothetical protein